MSELIILGLLSYPVSLAMNTISAFKVIKDVADNGYKFNTDNLSEFKDNSPLSDQLEKFKNVPFINMAIALYGGISYKTNRDNILFALNTMQCLDKMTKEEEEYYSKNPGAISAIKINKGIAIEKPNIVKMPVDPKLTPEEIKALREKMEKDYKDLGLNVEVSLYPGESNETVDLEEIGPRFTDEQIKFLEQELEKAIEFDEKEITIDTKKRTKTLVPRRKR